MTAPNGDAVAMLRPWLQHSDDCGDADAYNNADVRTCGCGLDSALEALAAAEQAGDMTLVPTWQAEMHGLVKPAPSTDVQQGDARGFNSPCMQPSQPLVPTLVRLRALVDSMKSGVYDDTNEETFELPARDYAELRGIINSLAQPAPVVQQGVSATPPDVERLTRLAQEVYIATPKTADGYIWPKWLAVVLAVLKELENARE